MSLSMVDFPHPEGPTIETNSFWATENEMSSTATTASAAAPKRLVTACTSIALTGVPDSAISRFPRLV